MKLLKRDDLILFGILAAFASLCALFLFGLMGARTVLGLVIFIWLPFYLLFDNLDMDDGEKIALSFFAGIVLFPSFVYWLGFLIPFRMSILVVFVLMVVGFFARKKFIGK